MNFNVLSYDPHSFSYYLRHPIKFLRYTKINIKNAWWRITKGWCPSDVWEWFNWAGTVIPEMFRYLAKNSAGYSDEFGSPEKYQDWLNSVADVLEYSILDSNEENKYYKQFLRTIGAELNSDVVSTINKEDEEVIRHNYIEEDTRIAKEKEKAAINAFNEIGKHFFDLWD